MTYSSCSYYIKKTQQDAEFRIQKNAHPSVCEFVSSEAEANRKIWEIPMDDHANIMTGIFKDGKADRAENGPQVG